MKNEINTQRPSPSSPHLSADTTGGAGEGLDVTACSASFIDRCVERIQDWHKNGIPEDTKKDIDELRDELIKARAEIALEKYGMIL